MVCGRQWKKFAHGHKLRATGVCAGLVVGLIAITPAAGEDIFFTAIEFTTNVPGAETQPQHKAASLWKSIRFTTDGLFVVVRCAMDGIFAWALASTGVCVGLVVGLIAITPAAGEDRLL
jgi:ammonia channel protein AmtB